MSLSILDVNDTLERQNEKLLKITSVLMRRVEETADSSEAAYAHFLRAVMLEEEIRQRTEDLEEALEALNRTNARLSTARAGAERARNDLSNALEAVQEGFALFDSEDRLVMCNSRFGMFMPDIRERLTPGLTFQHYVRLVSRSPALQLGPGETPGDWVGQRERRHAGDRVNFKVSLTHDHWVQVSEYRTPDGGTAIIQTDITDMVRLERDEREKLLDSQARLVRATLDHINQGICIFDDESRLAGWNGRLGELLGTPISLFRTGTSFRRFFSHLENSATVLGEESLDSIAGWVRRRGGRPAFSCSMQLSNGLFLDVFAQEMPDGGFVASFTDVTSERRATEAIYAANESLERRVRERTEELVAALGEAERANAHKTRFVAAASHDLLQPLSAAKLFVSSLDSRALGSDDRAVVGSIGRALDSVESILESLLDISRLDSGSAAVTVSDFPLDRVLVPLADEFAPAAARKGLAFRVVRSRATVRSDPGYLRRILQNLIANAIRYTDSGKVLVGARHTPDGLRLEVWDTGSGIPQDQQELIFREFHRGQRRSTEVGDGVGLGLAIVERACGLLGHRLELVSEPGRGTGFRVTVTSAASGPKSAEHIPAANPEDSITVNLAAMVIENDPEMRRALTAQLESWGVGVFDAAGAVEALGLLQELSITPDVLIVDYQLDDGRTGLSAIEAIRNLYGDIPALMVTASRDAGLQETCATSGIGYLPKPIEPAALQAWIRRSTGS